MHNAVQLYVYPYILSVLYIHMDQVHVSDRQEGGTGMVRMQDA